MKKSYPQLIWTVFVLIAVLGVLVYGAYKRELEEDESLALEGTRGDLFTTIDYQAHDVQAPLFFGLLNEWEQMMGRTEIILRMLSVLTSLITLAFVYRTAQDWFGKTQPWVGIAALAALGTSSYFFNEAIAIRPYPLMMLALSLIHI